MLSWTVDDIGTVYADGVQLGHSNNWVQTTQTELPSNTSLVAFELINPNDPSGLLDVGLLASLDNTWSTGDPGMKCADADSLTSTNDWKLNSM